MQLTWKEPEQAHITEQTTALNEKKVEEEIVYEGDTCTYYIDVTYDLHWDVSDDEPIDEETANAILESNCKHYTALECFLYIYF